MSIFNIQYPSRAIWSNEDITKPANSVYQIAYCSVYFNEGTVCGCMNTVAFVLVYFLGPGKRGLSTVQSSVRLKI